MVCEKLWKEGSAFTRSAAAARRHISIIDLLMIVTKVAGARILHVIALRLLMFISRYRELN